MIVPPGRIVRIRSGFIRRIVRTRSAFCVFLLLAIVLVFYQVSNSLRVMFDHSTGGNDDMAEIRMNEENGDIGALKTDHKPKEQTFPFGEKFPPFLKVKMKLNAGHKRQIDKNWIKIKADVIKSLVVTSFLSGLKRHADEQMRIILSVVDYGFVSFALNFKELSIDRLNITNFLLVCTDKRSHTELNLIGVPCCFFEYGSIGSDKPSDFGTAEYYEKTNLKTAVMIRALNFGYNVLMVDLDVILFKNPFPFFTCVDCDIHFQMDREMFNSGFVYVRPTSASQTLYSTAWNLYVKYQKAHDQAYINMAAKVLDEEKRLPKIYTLSTNQFPCGVFYFEHGNRMFGNDPPCVDCVMAHNNYIGSVSAKVYRFKENLLWMVDSDAYYSNASGKYLTYGNPADFGAQTMQMEVDALKNALAIAMVTNRTVILPTFRCCSCSSRVECSHVMHRCSLLSVLRLKQFDAAFQNSYREHSFLRHPKVPLNVKTSVTPCLFINSSSPAGVMNLSTGCQVFHASSYEDGATVEELNGWLDAYANVSVVRFHSLYGAHLRKQFDADKRLQKLKLLMEDSFKCSEYEQWDESAFRF